jgi:hypothetical protein
MSVQPYTSPSDPAPFAPGGGSAGGGTIPIGSAVPDLSMVFTTAPDFTPSGSQGTTGSTSSLLPPASDLSIDLGSLRDAENTMIGASTEIVGAYEALKSLFQSSKDTVFGQQLTTTAPASHGLSSATTGDMAKTANDAQAGPNGEPLGKITTPDPIQASAIAFANGQNGQPGMNDVEAFALQQVGNAMALLGQFMAMMNGAGYSYSLADASSVLPQAQIPSSS